MSVDKKLNIDSSNESEMLCYKCKNANTCKSPFKGDDIIECSNYVANVIDWESRRYEIAKDVAASLAQRPNAMYDNVVNSAIKIADKLIERLKEK